MLKAVPVVAAVRFKTPTPTPLPSVPLSPAAAVLRSLRLRPRTTLIMVPPAAGDLPAAEARCPTPALPPPPLLASAVALDRTIPCLRLFWCSTSRLRRTRLPDLRVFSRDTRRRQRPMWTRRQTRVRRPCPGGGRSRCSRSRRKRRS